MNEKKIDKKYKLKKEECLIIIIMKLTGDEWNIRIFIYFLENVLLYWTICVLLYVYMNSHISSQQLKSKYLSTTYKYI